jgi:short-subunit dehydrogenase
VNVVITGASSGIGRALVRTFARHGHPVLAVARREDRLQQLCREAVETRSAPVYCLALDITCEGAPQILMDEALRVFGKVHVLINNAGISPYQKFQDLNSGLLRQILAVNIQALTELCHLFIPHMLSHGEPSHVVNVGSVGGYAPLPNFAVYAGSKHYVRIFTNLLNREYRGSNIRISALHPGGTQTEFLDLAGEKVKKSAEKTMMTPEQVAAIAYPAILKGRRVIIPGTINQIACLLGKLLPFHLMIRLTEFIYNHSIDQVAPTYSLGNSSDKATISSEAGEKSVHPDVEG